VQLALARRIGDVHSDSRIATGEMKEQGQVIPRILHQTWKTAHVPDRYRQLVGRARELNPDWKYCLWTDNDCRNLIAQLHPRDLAMYDALPLHIMRIDVIRYFIMQDVGGFYLDLDYELLKPLEPYLGASLVLPCNRDPKLGEQPSLGNAIFGSARGHAFWGRVLDALRQAPPLEGNYDFHGVIDATGPGFLSRVFSQIQEPWKQEIQTPDRWIFHPPRPPSPRRRQAIIDRGDSIGIHHCFFTWQSTISVSRNSDKRPGRKGC